MDDEKKEKVFKRIRELSDYKEQIISGEAACLEMAHGIQKVEEVLSGMRERLKEKEEFLEHCHRKVYEITEGLYDFKKSKDIPF